MSRIDFTPAEITATGVRPSSVRSDDISIAEKGPEEKEPSVWPMILIK